MKEKIYLKGSAYFVGTTNGEFNSHAWYKIALTGDESNALAACQLSCTQEVFELFASVPMGSQISFEATYDEFHGKSGLRKTLRVVAAQVE